MHFIECFGKYYQNDSGRWDWADLSQTQRPRRVPGLIGIQPHNLPWYR